MLVLVIQCIHASPALPCLSYRHAAMCCYCANRLSQSAAWSSWPAPADSSKVCHISCVVLVNAKQPLKHLPARNSGYQCSSSAHILVKGMVEVENQVGAISSVSVGSPVYLVALNTAAAQRIRVNEEQHTYISHVLTELAHWAVSHGTGAA